MPEALPNLTRLVDANLTALGYDASSVDTRSREQMMSLVAPHIAWLHKVTCYLAGSGQLTCTWTADHGASVPTLPEPTQTEFTFRFGETFRQIRRNIQHDEPDAKRRKAQVARSIALAALAAYLAVPLAPNEDLIGLLTPPTHDDLVSAQVALQSVVMDFPPPLIRILPIFKKAESQVFTSYVYEIRQGFQVLDSQESTPRLRYEKAGKISDLIAYGAAVLLKSKFEYLNCQSKKLHEQAVHFLLESGLCTNPGQAASRLRQLGIGDTYSMRNVAVDQKVRFPTKNSEHQASFRGKETYIEILGKTLVNAGLLTPSMIQATTASKKHRKILASMISLPDSSFCHHDSTIGDQLPSVSSSSVIAVSAALPPQSHDLI